MIGLRQKLALGFGGLLLVALALGLYGVTRVDRLGSAIDVILRENYRSVLAMQEAKEALERMDSGALYALLGFGGDTIHAEHDPRFRQALAVQSSNITLEGEKERVERLRALYATYRDTLAVVLDSSQSADVRRARYFGTLQPLFFEIKGEADAILRMNQENMAEANEAARRAASMARQRMFLLLLCGVLLAAALTALTSRSILRPVRRLQRSAEEVQQGNLDVVVSVAGRDELARLAQSFNAMTAYLRDVRRSDQAHLVRTQRATQLAIDHLPDAVAVLAPDGTVELSNTAARRLFHLHPGTVPNAERFGSMTRTAAESGLRDAVQVFDGDEERFFQPQIIPVRDEDRFLAGRILVLSDVTGLRRAYEVNASFLGRLAHELGTPLTSLQMALHLLLAERTGALTPKQTELLVAARTDAERLAELTDDLSGLSDSATPDVLDRQPVTPRALAEQATQRFQSVCRERGVALHVDVPENLSPVAADADRIALLLHHLLENALQHTPPGGDVRLSAEAVEGSDVRFAVADTGSGIPEEVLPHLFERFYRGPDATADQAGLGLSVAQEIARAHGSTIQVTSRTGEGSTFSFQLTRAPKAQTSETRMSEMRASEVERASNHQPS